MSNTPTHDPHIDGATSKAPRTDPSIFHDEATGVFEQSESGAELGAAPPCPPAGATRVSSTGATGEIPFDAAAPSAGMLVGQYLLVEKLGEGGMGTVWKARHLRLDKFVALKLLAAQQLRTPSSLERFDREMRAVGRIEHPHLVRAYDAGDAGGAKYLVMEYIDGMDLASQVRRNGPMPVRQALQAIEQAARGLAAAHRAGLVHRDIKPGNLMLDRSGQVKVTDLGLARLGDDAGEVDGPLTSAGMILGTPDYMAPEQWDDTHSVDHRSDLYSLGCTLFFLLTGQAPFADRKTAMQKMVAHAKQPLPDVREARITSLGSSMTGDQAATMHLECDVSDGVVALIARLCAKLPEARFDSADELLTALEPLRGERAPQPDSDRTQLVSAIMAETQDPGSPESVKRGWKLALWGGITTAILCLGIVIIFARPNGTNQTIELNPREKVETVSNEARLQISARNSKSEPTQPRDPAPEETNPYRRAAREVIAAGGAVHITGLVPGSTNELQRITLTPGMALPDEPFFVNGVNVSGNPGWTDSGMPALRRLPELDFLAINGTAVTDAGLAALSPGTAVGILSVSYSQVSDAEARLPNLPGLCELNCGGVRPMSARFVKELPRAKRLRRLSFFTTENVDLSPLGRMEALNILGCTPLPSASNLRHLAELPHLRGLHGGGTIDLGQVEALAAIRSLRWVGLTEVVPKEMVERLQAARPDLVVVHPSVMSTEGARKAVGQALSDGVTLYADPDTGRPVSDLPAGPFRPFQIMYPENRPVRGDVSYLRELRGLESILAYWVEDADTLAEQLALLDTLTKVSIDGSTLTAKGLARLASLMELESLDLGSKPLNVSDADWEPFSKCLWLTRINLMNASLGDAGLVHLCKSGAVQDLTLHGLAKLTPAGLEPLTGMPRLVRLNLNHTRVGDAAVETLVRCRHLRWLGLWETGITPAGVERLAKQLPHCAIHHNGGLVIPKPLPDGGP